MDLEEDVVQALQNLIDGIFESIEIENLFLEELFLDDDSDLDENFIDVNFLNLRAPLDDEVNALMHIVAGVEQLEEDEQVLIAGMRQVRDGRHLQVNIEHFRSLGDPEFKRHFRMEKPIFELLVLEFGNHLVATNRLIRLRTGLDVCLLMSLWILGNISSFRGTGVVFGVAQSVVHFHYTIVIEALRELAPKFIKWPSEAEKAHCKARCLQRTGFPGIIGMMDGSLVKVTAPVFQPARYFDRHHSYSINVHTVCDHNLILRHVYVGEPGSTHDATVFLRSPLYNLILERNDIVGEHEHILADSAYTLTNMVLTPYRNNGNVTRRKRRYNFLHSSNRMPVERTNGHWKEKWRRLYRFHVINFNYALDHIMATLMLHNFVKLDGRESDGIQLPRQAPVAPNEDPVPREHPLLAETKSAGILKRDAIALLLTPEWLKVFQAPHTSQRRVKNICNY